MSARALAWITLSLAAADSALAAGGESGAGGHGSPVADMIWLWFNFALLGAATFFLARKPIRKLFADRRGRVVGELDESAQILERAEERFGEWQRKLGSLNQELDQIRATAERRVREERASILADARATAERIKRDAAAAVEQELRRARAALREEASDLAVELAASLLREQVGDGDRERLIDDFIARVEQSSAPGTKG